MSTICMKQNNTDRSTLQDVQVVVIVPGTISRGWASEKGNECLFFFQDNFILFVFCGNLCTEVSNIFIDSEIHWETVIMQVTLRTEGSRQMLAR